MGTTTPSDQRSAAREAARSPSLPFPEVIDSTMRADFAACPMKFYYGRLHNFSKQATNVHRHFGGVFARALEVYRVNYWSEMSERPHDPDYALNVAVKTIIQQWGDYEPPANSPKTVWACIDALASYFEQWNPATDIFIPHIVDGQPTVETTFAVPIPGTRHPTTGNPLLYAGRYDMLAVRRGSENQLYIEDDKTTGSLGESWIDQWRLRAQFTGYAWAAREHDIHINGVIVRGVGILKTQINFAEAIQSRANWKIDTWLSQLRRDVDRMLAAYDSGIWDQNFDNACSQFGGCHFADLCDSPQPERWFNQYTVSPWNPLVRPD